MRRGASGHRGTSYRKGDSCRRVRCRRCPSPILRSRKIASRHRGFGSCAGVLLATGVLLTAKVVHAVESAAVAVRLQYFARAGVLLATGVLCSCAGVLLATGVLLTAEVLLAAGVLCSCAGVLLPQECFLSQGCCVVAFPYGLSRVAVGSTIKRSAQHMSKATRLYEFYDARDAATLARLRSTPPCRATLTTEKLCRHNAPRTHSRRSKRLTSSVPRSPGRLCLRSGSLLRRT